MNKSFTNKDKFELGKTDIFKFNADNVGEITKVNISHDGKGKLFYSYVSVLNILNNIISHFEFQGTGAGWFLEKLTVENTFTGEKVE